MIHPAAHNINSAYSCIRRMSGSVGYYTPRRGQTGESYALIKDLEEFYNNAGYLRDQQAAIDKDNTNPIGIFRYS